MIEKKRKTVTTIETHEVWVIRTGVPEPGDDGVTIMPRQRTDLDVTVVPSSEHDDSSKQRKEHE